MITQVLCHPELVEGSIEYETVRQSLHWACRSAHRDWFYAALSM